MIDVTFLAPVYPGDEVTLTAEVTSPGEEGRAACQIVCAVSDRMVLAGNASVPVLP